MILEQYNLKISLLGDVALNGLFVTQTEKNKERLKEVNSILKESDLVFCNLETCLKGNEGCNKNKENRGVILYSSEDAFNQILPGLNISAVSLANNHIFDWKKSGMEKTIHYLENSNIKFTGAGYKKEHIEPVILKREKNKIAFLAYVHKDSNPVVSWSSNILINYFDEDKVMRDVGKLKCECQLIILSIHWGKDYSFYPTKYQRIMSYKLIDAGVDILMGHHPHTLQPFEIYKNALIFYSLGSLCFGDFVHEGKLRSLKLKTKRSMIVNFNEAGQIIDLIPTKELIGNKVIITNKNLKRSLSFKFNLMKLKHKFKIFDWFIRIKEAIFDRLVEYFFGYYKNPFFQLFSLRNVKKMKYIIRDLKRKS